MANDLSRRIGTLIAEARAEAGLSQAELGERVEMHVQSISNIERGEVLPTLPTLMDLAKAFGVGIQDLLPGPQQSTPKISQRRMRLETEIRRLVRELPDDRLEIARDHVALVTKLK